jgi:uncharacterized RDD family membrane protein YckC
MEQILDLPSANTRTVQFAGFWIRVAAYIIDYFVVSIVSYGILAVFGISAFADPTNFNFSLFFAAYGLIMVAWLGYYAVMESSTTQGTLGKMAVGIKVGTENGERISTMNALGRNLGKIVSSLILCIGYMMAGWDSKKQALHDKIAGTYVFYGNK